MPEMRPSSYAIVSVDEALRIVVEHTPVLQHETVGLTAALGRVLAEDLRAGESLPPFAASAVDGYAVRAVDGKENRRVLAEITAGHVSDTVLGAYEAMRIMTGAPLPGGANAVVMVEEATEVGGWLTVQTAVKRGDNVIPIGLDVTAGQLVLGSGTRVGSAEIALLATTGFSQLKVHRRPAVAVLSTGDELVEPGEAVAAGQIRDSNRYGLLAAIAEAECQPVSLGRVRDDSAEQTRLIKKGLGSADVVLTSGGVSVGSRDLIKPILERLGKVHFGRVAIKPGKPLTFATMAGKLVFGLPGFPVSSLVTFELFVRPALLRMQGRTSTSRPVAHAFLEHEIVRTQDRVEFQRGIVREADGRLLARTSGIQASSRVFSLVGANGLLKIPAGKGRLVAGEQVEVVLLGPL